MTGDRKFTLDHIERDDIVLPTSKNAEDFSELS